MHIELIQKQLEAIFNFSYDGIWICNGEGIILRCNPAAARINNIDESEVIGKHISILIDKGVVDKTVTEEVIKQKRQVSLMQYSPKTLKKLLVTGSPIFDGNGEILMVVTNDRDITELDKLRHQLLENEARSQRFLEELQRRDLKSLNTNFFVARSPIMQHLLKMAANAAQFRINVLLCGESGAGKSLLAETIHSLSDRKKHPFVRVDCGSIPSTLLESEIFGYERGAFTGASESGKIGLFEMANQGTLFLDEITDIPFETQHKLLRFIEKGEFIRVGGTKTINVDVRLISATNRDLEKEVAASRFRNDLYYRIRVVPLQIPPLRDRHEDLPMLVNHFLQKFSSLYQVEKTMSAPAMEALMQYRWPGNVRELEHLIERLVVMGNSETIEISDLPQRVSQREPAVGTAPVFAGRSLKEATRQFEKLLIEAALKEHGSQAKAAKRLSVSQSTIARKLKP